MSARQSSHAYAVMTLIPMAWFLFGGCGGAAQSEADARPTCTTQVVSQGMPSSGDGSPEGGADTERPGIVHVTNAAECELSARLASSNEPDDPTGKDSPLTTECKALCCVATSCAGTIVRCSPLPGDEVKCDAFGY